MSVPGNKVRPPKDELVKLADLTRKQIARRFGVSTSTVSKWSAHYQICFAADDRWGGDRKTQYRHNRRPVRDITQERHDGPRPQCAKCGKPMAKAGATSQGMQKWRCGANDKICSTLVFGAAQIGGRPRSKIGSDEELAEMLKAGATFAEIAEKFSVSRQTVANRIWERGLTGLSQYQRTARPRSDEPVQQADAFMLGVRQPWTRIEGINGYRFSGMGGYEYGI